MTTKRERVRRILKKNVYEFPSAVYVGLAKGLSDTVSDVRFVTHDLAEMQRWVAWKRKFVDTYAVSYRTYVSGDSSRPDHSADPIGIPAPRSCGRAPEPYDRCAWRPPHECSTHPREKERSDMYEFKRYRRKHIAELRPWTPDYDMTRVSVSAADIDAGSPRPGDMIARNPKNHDDQWLVAAQYFADNFEPVVDALSMMGPEHAAANPMAPIAGGTFVATVPGQMLPIDRPTHATEGETKR